MTLIDNFYTVKSQNIAHGKAEFRVELNAENVIYQAHFPNNPITPGVCLIQIVTELFCLLKKQTFHIQTLNNVKFTMPINPLEFGQVDFLLEFTQNEDLWQIKALIKEDETIFAKMSMALKN